MNPKNVVSLELSKKLKEVDYPQLEGEFWWACLLEHETSKPIRYVLEIKGHYPSCLSNELWADEEDNIVAPLVSELMGNLSNNDLDDYIREKHLHQDGLINLFRNPNMLAKVFIWKQLKDSKMIG